MFSRLLRHPSWKRSGSILKDINKQTIYRVARKKTPRTFRNYNGAYTLWGEISFGTFVGHYVILLTVYSAEIESRAHYAPEPARLIVYQPEKI